MACEPRAREREGRARGAGVPVGVFPRKRGPGEAALPTTKDGSNPTTDGANALGFLVHGDAFLIKLASKVNFKMIAESGSFEVTAELVEVG